MPNYHNSMENGNLDTKAIVLVGMMGSGKSSVGIKLAELLALDFVDVDHEIERISQMTIAEIFKNYGEAEFRELEMRVLKRLLEKQQVIATGGGAFVREDNRELIRAHGVSVWIDAELETLWGRVKGKSHRPLLNTENPKSVLSDILEARRPFYALADYRVESKADAIQSDVALMIANQIGLQIKAEKE